MSKAYDDFRQGFINALLWSENCFDEEGNDPCGWGNFEWADEDDIEWEGMAAIDASCHSFWGEFVRCVGGELAKAEAAKAGHDFCLTRNGHGAGFWDGCWPEHGDALTALSKPYGCINLLWQGEGELIHVHG